MKFVDSAPTTPQTSASPYVITSGSGPTGQLTISHYRFYQEDQHLISYRSPHTFDSALDFHDEVVKTLQRIADGASWATLEEIEEDVEAAREEVRRGI